MTNEELAVLGVVVLTLFTGLGFGGPALYGMKSLADGNGVPTVFGFPAYGGGGFERAGWPSTVPLLAAFFVVCAAELVTAYMLWDGQALGGWLNLLLLAPGAVFWWGFDLPVPWVLAVARIGLLWAGWGTLK